MWQKKKKKKVKMLRVSLMYEVVSGQLRVVTIQCKKVESKKARATLDMVGQGELKAVPYAG